MDPRDIALGALLALLVLREWAGYVRERAWVKERAVLVEKAAQVFLGEVPQSTRKRVRTDADLAELARSRDDPHRPTSSELRRRQ